MKMMLCIIDGCEQAFLPTLVEKVYPYTSTNGDRKAASILFKNEKKIFITNSSYGTTIEYINECLNDVHNSFNRTTILYGNWDGVR